MKKKSSPVTRLSVSNAEPHKAILNWHNVPKQDLWLYARSFHTAATKLAGMLELDSGPFTDFDAGPGVFMYRHAVELHLKALVLGEGGNFLATRPDALSVYKTHSVSWLAQFVCQIITAVKWEKEFKCEGIENLADFKAVIEELNAVDPGSCVFRLPLRAEGQDSAPCQVKLTIREFARRMDALLALLDSTADALAAEWDMHTESGHA
ncbi:MAG: hypothetical protein ABSG26_08110 [Bryobacteraceae bacterium]